MKKMIVLIVFICLMLQTAIIYSIPPPDIRCMPEIAWQAHLLILPLFMLVVSYDNSVNFDQSSEIKIADKEIIKFFQIYINEKTIFVFLLILPAGLDVPSDEGKVIDVEIDTADQSIADTYFYLYSLGWPV